MDELMAYVNGRVLPESQAAISIYDQGFLAGIGVFERTRTFHGELFRLDEHLARLQRSLRMTRLQAGMTMAELKAVTIDLVAINRKLLGPTDDYSVGHYISQGAGGGPTVVIFCQPIAFKTFAHQYLTGAHVVTPSVRQTPTEVLDPKMKTTSRMHFHLAEIEARQVDPEAYALLLDLDGNVCETRPGMNFWIVQTGTIVTPPGRSILEGITREAVFELAAMLDVPVKETDFQVFHVINADEAFLTGTSKCIVPVTRINGSPIGDGKPGPVVTRLQKGWAENYGLDFVGEALSHVEQQAERGIAAAAAAGRR